MMNINEIIEPFHGRYILDDDGNPIPEPDLIKWAKWIENNNDRQIRKTCINGVYVSTVFLGLDHTFLEEGPILWETMEFNGKHDQYMWRYATREEAIKGHEYVCNGIRKRFNKKHVHPLDQKARSVGDKELRRRRYADLDLQLDKVGRQLQ